MTRPLELLAPARNLECGKAAIDHGADAVYIGAPHFGARAAAGNSVGDIAELCAYAHCFRARVYVTVNTIVYDAELPDALLLLRQLKEAGVDAVLLQDMGLLQACLDLGLAAHASTQTDNRNSEKVGWLRRLGFRRVVLARELSADEIHAVHEQEPDVELEVFVHGALCVSYSGLCYASQHCFHRSANRGECAQFCRMKFSLEDADGHTLVADRHLLSLKDLALADHLEALAEAGATSFKIEGRLKDVAYVKNVTAAYSQRLDQLCARYPDRYRRASLGRCTYSFHPDLRKTFNRSYTTYFLHGRQADMASPLTPKAVGEPVGTVKDLRRDSLAVAGVARFANGDGLCFINAQGQLEGFRVNRVDAHGRLFPLKMPASLRTGMSLFRNQDHAFEQQLAHDSSTRRIPLTLSLNVSADGFTLRGATDDGIKAEATLPTSHQPAEKPQRDNIVRQLSRLGNTEFECREVEVAADFPYFIPSSQLADLRRQLVEQLRRAIAQPDTTSPSSSVPSSSPSVPSPPPAYPYTYLYNIANAEARRFYAQCGVGEAAPCFEEEPRGPQEAPRGEVVLMQCRYCLRHQMGYCTRHGGQPAPWREPLSLVLADGRRFGLRFDCQRCQMNVVVSKD